MARTSPAPKDIASQAVARLRKLADPVRAAGSQRYFKDTIKAFGATTPQVRGLAAELFLSVRGGWTVADAVSCCDMLVAETEVEAKAVGLLLLARFKRDFPASLFGTIKGWLAADLLANWASVDLISTDSMGALLAKYPGLVVRIRGWARHPNRWVKRASAVSFIKLARKPEFRAAVYEIAASLFPFKDDLVEKANGWLLREAGKADPARLERFLLGHGPKIPRTTLRYSIERFDAKTRKRLLEATRR